MSFAPVPVRRRRGGRGFTLLEVMVATLIMGIAIAGLLGNLNTSLLNEARLTDSDRAAMLAKRQMDALLVTQRLPIGEALTGTFPPGILGEGEAGWRAQAGIFEARPGAGPGSDALERIQLQIYWTRAQQERTFDLDGYRRRRLRPGDAGNQEQR